MFKRRKKFNSVYDLRAGDKFFILYDYGRYAKPRALKFFAHDENHVIGVYRGRYYAVKKDSPNMKYFKELNS